MGDTVVLDGSCTLINNLDGSCSLTSVLDGQATAVLKVRENVYYEGSYEYDPSEETQTIQIEGLTGRQNIIINPIPSNYGKIVWNGSTLQVI